MAESGWIVDTRELDRLVADLSAMPAKRLVEASKALVKSGHDLAARAQANAPVDTGFLRSSISVSAAGEDRPPRVGDLAVEVGPTAEYGAAVEYGTSKMAPRMYMGVAFDQTVPELVEALEGVVADLLEGL